MVLNIDICYIWKYITVLVNIVLMTVTYITMFRADNEIDGFAEGSS